MDVLESLVRDTLIEHADDAPSDDGLLDAVTRRRSRRWPVVLAAAAVVVLAAGLAVVLSSGPHPHKQAAGPTSPTTTHPTSRTPTTGSAIAGTPMKFVSYHGIVIVVPTRLPVLTVPCTLPAEYVLAADPTAAYGCPAQLHPPRPTFTVTFATDPGARGTGQIRYRHIAGYPGAGGVLDVAQSPVAVTVTAPTRAQVREILTSVRHGADVNGCPASFGPVSNPVAHSLVPGTPVSAVRCQYAIGYWLLASTTLRSPVRLAHAIDALGLADHSAEGPPYERDLLRFGYADGSVRTLQVRLNSPSSFSDGHRTEFDRNTRTVLSLIWALAR